MQAPYRPILRQLVSTVKGWPRKVQLAAAGGLAVVLLLTVVALTSGDDPPPNTPAAQPTASAPAA